MRTHIVVVAWLHIVLSSLTLLGGLILALCFFVTGAAAPPALPLFGGMGALVLILFFGFSIPGIIMGIGLLQFAPWARILAIVLSVLGLVFHPVVGVGTLIGIYSLVILFNSETEALFKRRQFSGASPIIY